MRKRLKKKKEKEFKPKLLNDDLLIPKNWDFSNGSIKRTVEKAVTGLPMKMAYSSNYKFLAEYIDKTGEEFLLFRKTNKKSKSIQ